MCNYVPTRHNRIAPKSIIIYSPYKYNICGSDDDCTTKIAHEFVLFPSNDIEEYTKIHIHGANEKL